MEQWMKKLSGALIASALALTLSTKASAELAEEDEALPSEDPAIEEEAAPAGGEGILLLSANVHGDPGGSADDTAGAPGGDAGLTTFDTSSGNGSGSDLIIGDQTAGDGSGTGGDGAGSDDPTGANNDPSVGPTVEDSAYISVDGEMIYPDQQTEIIPSSYEANGFWGYDTGSTDATTDDSLYMVDCDVNTVEAHNCDLYIVSAGVNEIGTIDAGQGGNVYVSGTGIMLVDDIFLGEGNGFYLQPIEGSLYGSGSVAVFVNTAASCLADLAQNIENLSSYPADGSTYVLVNGSVPGILDENYVIPEGINLIMPAGTTIEMVSPGSCAIAIEDAGDVTGQLFIPSSTLTIPSGSSLTVEEDASIVMTGKEFSDPLAFHQWAVTYAPVINIAGELNGEGSINGTGIVVLNIGETDPKPATPAIASSVFELIIRDGFIHYQDLDDELYDYLLANLSTEDFAYVTDNGGDPEACLDFDEGRWGIHVPVFAFTIDWLETSHFGFIDDPVSGDGRLSWFRWGIDTLGMGGAGPILENITSSTGSGILGGIGAGEYKGDSSGSTLIIGSGGSGGSGELSTAANHSLVLVVTDKETCYNLAAFYDGEQIYSLASKVTVRFYYPAPTEEGRFFVVFRNGDGSLTAFVAAYDSVTGELVFRGDKLGNFAVVCIDYTGEFFTKDFYDYLETLESIKTLTAGF